MNYRLMSRKTRFSGRKGIHNKGKTKAVFKSGKGIVFI